MDGFPTIPSVIGLGFVVVVFVFASVQIIKIVIAALERNSASNEKVALALDNMKKSMDNNTDATKANSELTKASVDLYTRTLVDVLRTNKEK